MMKMTTAHDARSESGIVPTKYWHKTKEGRIQCDVCPRACVADDGDRL